MAYVRYRNSSKPTSRTITVKYDGTCAACGGSIKAGQIAMYHPAGSTVAGAVGRATLEHIGGLDGSSRACSAVLRNQRIVEDSQVASYVAEGLGEW